MKNYKQTKTWHEIVHAAMALITFVLILMAPLVASAQTVTNPQSGSVGLEGKVEGPPPTTPAVITSPANGLQVEGIPLPVRGSCPEDTLVQVYRNGVFAGSTLCSDGTFEVNIDLASGENSIQIRIFDALNQEGPRSNIVTITYIREVIIVSGGTVPDDLTLTTNYASIGVDPGDKLIWPLRISGGQPPYAVTVSWGDNSDDAIYSITRSGLFDVDHIYGRSGSYGMTVKAVDQDGQIAFLQLAAVVNGPDVAGLTQTGDGPDVGATILREYIIWPMYIAMLFIPATFAIGLSFEKRRLIKRLNRQMAK